MKSMGRIFIGLVKCGAWGCFDDYFSLVFVSVGHRREVYGAYLHRAGEVWGVGLL